MDGQQFLDAWIPLLGFSRECLKFCKVDLHSQDFKWFPMLDNGRCCAKCIGWQSEKSALHGLGPLTFMLNVCDSSESCGNYNTMCDVFINSLECRLMYAKDPWNLYLLDDVPLAVDDLHGASGKSICICKSPTCFEDILIQTELNMQM